MLGHGCVIAEDISDVELAAMLEYGHKFAYFSSNGIKRELGGRDICPFLFVVKEKIASVF